MEKNIPKQTLADKTKPGPTFNSESGQVYAGARHLQYILP